MVTPVLVANARHFPRLGKFSNLFSKPWKTFRMRKAGRQEKISVPAFLASSFKSAGEEFQRKTPRAAEGAKKAWRLPPGLCSAISQFHHVLRRFFLPRITRITRKKIQSEGLTSFLAV
jgi:hypothetical protein